MKVPCNIEEMARVLDACPFIGASIGCDKHDGSIKIAEYLYHEGYSKQSEVIDEFAERLKEYPINNLKKSLTVAEIIDEVAMKMKGGAE